jgi:hypothetical protein
MQCSGLWARRYRRAPAYEEVLVSCPIFFSMWLSVTATQSLSACSVLPTANWTPTRRQQSELPAPMDVDGDGRDDVWQFMAGSGDTVTN